MSPWQQAAFASHALLIGTWAKRGRSVSDKAAQGEYICIHTSDQNGDIERRALDTQVTTTKDGAEQPGVGRIAHLLDLVAAVELGIAARLDALLNRVVAADLCFVGGAVAAVLSVVADLLVPGAVVAGGLDLAREQGGRRDAEGQSEDGEDVEEHGCGLKELGGCKRVW